MENQNDKELEVTEPSSPPTMSLEAWRDRVNRLLSRRQLNGRDSDCIEEDDDELSDLTKLGRELGYRLK